MSVIRPIAPFFNVSDEDDDVWVFDTEVAALGAMEPPEVVAGYHILFDGQGRRARLGVAENDVIVEAWEADLDWPDLARRLVTFLDARQRTVPDTAANGFIAEAAELVRAENRRATFPRLPAWVRRKKR